MVKIKVGDIWKQTVKEKKEQFVVMNTICEKNWLVLAEGKLSSKVIKGHGFNPADYGYYSKRNYSLLQCLENDGERRLLIPAQDMDWTPDPEPRISLYDRKEWDEDDQWWKEEHPNPERFKKFIGCSNWSKWEAPDRLVHVNGKLTGGTVRWEEGQHHYWEKVA